MFLPSFQLQNKIAIVTGAGRGIGRALAIGLAEAGADVALFARTASDIEEVANEIRALGRKAYPFTVDVTNREQIEEAVQQLIEQTGRLDILVNNAGMNIRSQALAVTDEEWDTIMQTNLKSAFLCSQIVGRHM
ncbi:SDR family NAD(P)-dependent oxidoreductase, partial [Paenibacillus sp. TAF58]